MGAKTISQKALPKRRTITIPDQSYQPPKAEQEREHDMPGASTETIRRAFFRPFNVKRRPVE